MKTPIRTLTALVALALAAAFVGSACSSVMPQALVVNDWSLSAADFNSQLEAVADTGLLLTSAVQDVSADPATYSTELTASLLNVQVTFAVATQANRQRGNEVTDDDRTEASTYLTQNLTGRADATASDDGSTDAPSVFDSLPESFRQNLVEGYANYLVLGRDLADAVTTEEGLRDLYDAQVESGAAEQACVRLIFVRAGDGQTQPSDADLARAQAEAQDVADALGAGADFGAVATARSDDPQSAAEGGSIGCFGRGQLNNEDFDSAIFSLPVGEVSPPLQTTQGYFLIEVESREVPSFDDARGQLQSLVASDPETAAFTLFGAIARSADVWVDPKYGQWSPETATVQPPSGAQAPPSSAVAGLLGSAG